MELSLAGLIGAFIGTASAAAAYVPLVTAIERAFRTNVAGDSSEDRGRLGQEISLLRRAVLLADIAIFAGIGYWLAMMLAE